MAQAADRKAGGCEEQEPSGEDVGERWWRWAIASAGRDDRDAAAARQRPPGGAT